jgi:predicted phage tail protein
MMRKVYLIGEIEKKFGSEFSMFANSYADIIKNINCNRPGFKEYLLNSEKEGIDFTINYAGRDIEEKDLLTPLKEGDVTIAAIPTGSKSDAARVVTGAILIAISFIPGLGPSIAMGLRMYGANMAMQGIQAILAPDPATDETEPEGYLYQGSEAIIVEGDPVPVLYGKLRVPGQPISVAFNTVGASGHNTGYVESNHSVTIDGITVVVDIQLDNLVLDSNGHADLGQSLLRIGNYFDTGGGYAS